MRKSRLNYIQAEENIEEDDLDEMNDVDEAKGTSPRLELSKKGPQTYKFADLAELIVEKEEDLFDDELESNSDSDYDDSETGESTGQLPGSSLRIKQMRSSDR